MCEKCIFYDTRKAYEIFSKNQLQNWGQSDTLRAEIFLPMIASKKIKMSILSILTLSLFSAVSVSAMETIFVTASQKAGRYYWPIYVRLTASNPEAKIWYTCRRNGTPSDLLKYESPILLNRSCALIYFAYVTNQIESKIERTDYTILYSDDVTLETNDEILGLRNAGNTTVDIGGWEVIAGTGAITIPPGTTLTPGGVYSMGKVDPASYELKSPEWYIKSQISLSPEVPEVKKSIAKAPSIKPKPTTDTVIANLETKDLVTEVTPTENTTWGAVTSIAPPAVPTSSPNPTSLPSQEVSSNPTPPPSGPNSTTVPTASNIKASSTEAQNTSALPIIVVLSLIAAGVAIRKW